MAGSLICSAIIIAIGIATEAEPLNENLPQLVGMNVCLIGLLGALSMFLDPLSLERSPHRIVLDRTAGTLTLEGRPGRASAEPLES